MAKHGLRYLKATHNMELCFDGSDIAGDMNFHGYLDTDWSGDRDTSQSTSGFIFIITLSSTEFKYIGLSNAGQHLAWLHTFFSEMGHPPGEVAILACNNIAAIILTKDP
ncbi:Retrovirus-related Pol polyprotein from transposon TNT 1-94 [Trametes pubescens]|uniref:Retrovirus-related Pol polyprotein from transposon TNT 1-94 n=1 Tax=Trametes pubescens TaxID=154538 RepID=A0A1M2V1W9_TRAPU|nr:Retrovirus-related Pol polyprotein from transposon TNT 1-94 [Trametes pubescens]